MSNAIDQNFTAKEVAVRLRCTARKVTKTATEFGIGANLGGRAGYRFTEAEIDQIRESMRPKAGAA